MARTAAIQTSGMREPRIRRRASARRRFSLQHGATVPKTLQIIQVHVILSDQCMANGLAGSRKLAFRGCLFDPEHLRDFLVCVALPPARAGSPVLWARSGGGGA